MTEKLKQVGALENAKVGNYIIYHETNPYMKDDYDVILEITRISKAYVFCGDKAFRITDGKKRGTGGASGYKYLYVKLATHKDKARVKQEQRQRQLISNLEECDYNQFNDEFLTILYHVIETEISKIKKGNKK